MRNGMGGSVRRKRAAGWAAALALVMVAGLSGCGAVDTVPHVTYYVSNSGSDLRSGLSPGTAWRTLARVARQDLHPGDHVELERGSVFREPLVITASGTAVAPIVYGAYGSGPRPVVSGADLVSGWQKTTNGVYVAPLSVDPMRVWVSGVELARGSSVTSLVDNQFEYAQGSLYIKLPAGASPPPAGVEASQRSVAVSDPQGHSYVTLEDIVAEKTNDPSKEGAAFNARIWSDYWVVDRCVARYSAGNGFFGEAGVSSGIGSHLLVVDSEAYGNWRRGAVAAGHATVDQVFKRLYSHDNGLDGLLINSRDGVLVDSRLDDNGTTPGQPRHGFYMYPWDGGASGWDISGNNLVGNRNSGGRIAGSDNRIIGNYVSDSPYGFFVVDSDGVNQGQTIEGNVFTHTSLDGYAIELEGAQDTIVSNNSMFDAAGIGVVAGAIQNTRGLVVSNNQFGGAQSGAFIYVESTQASGLTLQGNCYDPAMTASNVKASTLTTASLPSGTGGTELSAQSLTSQSITLPLCGSN